MGRQLEIKIVVTCLLSNFHYLNSCETSRAVNKIQGNAIIAGIFDGHDGANCTDPQPYGQHKMDAAAAAVQALADINYIPGVKIGLSLYEGCSRKEMAQKNLVTALVEAECDEAHILGVITSLNIATMLTPLARTLHVAVSIANDIPASLLNQLAVTLVIALDWPSIDLFIAPSQELLDQFSTYATEQRICVNQQMLLSNAKSASFKSGEVIVIAGPSDVLHEAIPNVSDFKLLVIPFDNNFDYTSEHIPKGTFLILPTAEEELRRVEDNFTKTKENDLVISESSLSSLQMMADILQIANTFKSSLIKHCIGSGLAFNICLEMIPTKPAVVKPILQDSETINEVSKLLSVSEYTDIFVILQINDEAERIGSFQMSNKGWDLSLIYDKENVTNTKQWLCPTDLYDNSSVVDCRHCSNYKQLYDDHFKRLSLLETLRSIVNWRPEAWIAAMATIASVGIACCIAIAIFILYRVCKKDILEGNPMFSLLLLLAIIVTYASILPFSFKVIDPHHHFTGLFCSLRVFTTSLSYSLIFSIMLARSIMLASCDQDGGFMSHVNGYLQTMLCFFIAAVQVALSIQFWAISWSLLSAEQCVAMTKGHLFILLLCYDMLLLILLILVAPFITKSKRNYHEGAFFAAATMLCFVAWVMWLACYFFLPEDWQDFSVMFGLCAIATIVLVTIFIPRTYLMMTGIVRDNLASSLPSLAYHSSNSIVDVNYRSTQALYDSVSPAVLSKGEINPNYYSGRPNTPSTSKVESRCRPRTPEVPFATIYDSSRYDGRYDTPPSTLNITRF